MITLWAQTAAALLFGLAFFAVFYANLYIALRLSSRIHLVREDVIHIPPVQIANRPLNILILTALLFLQRLGRSQRHGPMGKYPQVSELVTVRRTGPPFSEGHRLLCL